MKLAGSDLRKSNVDPQSACRWHRDAEWVRCRWQREDWDASVVNFEWKQVVEPLMEQYTESTDGSYIEWKESAMVWHHRDADPDFGSWQAKELLDHLESVLANQPVTVKSGAHIVEVKPQVIFYSHTFVIGTSL